MLALQPASILVAHGSHHEVQLWGREVTNAGSVGLSEAVLGDLHAATPYRRLVRLRLFAGELMFVHGNLMCAVDVMSCSGYSLQLQWTVKSADDVYAYLLRSVAAQLASHYL